ncbi:hypothetical protein CVT24_007842 [Panaeolus cyanescens]|uniref:Homeobox domain-containing protein n=1 Tax=Panaeolus cyanescens TaxID=181874 RepID=A0A409VZK3_9AGAR|nr:hypothetical protein CVT24_007842 [Panaeolus cyanescens]
MLQTTLPQHPQRSVSPFVEDRSPRRSSSRHSGAPYGSLSANFARPRRSRPEPYQLEALKELFMKTSTPTIEERSVLAFKIGMEVGKVTNWFRNLRQTARKRAKKSGSGDDDDDAFTAGDIYSASVSRSGTPSLGSSSSSIMDNDEPMDLDYDQSNHSDMGSDDEDQEAVTPSPEPSPSPQSPPPEPVPRAYPQVEPPKHVTRPLSDLEQAAKQYANIRVEDALLLLSFHQTIIVH